MKTSLLLRTLKVAASGLPGGTSFMEDYTYHLVPGEEKILGAHMLEVCPSIAEGRPRRETTTRRLAHELRWNQAYHRLAQGF